VGRQGKTKDVVTVLEALTSLYPAPTYIRSDNGSRSSLRPYGLVRGGRHHHGRQPARITLGERV
jgi:hypothetical protein